jgi:hypothetical protein
MTNNNTLWWFLVSVALLGVGYFFGRYRTKRDRDATNINEAGEKFRQIILKEMQRLRDSRYAAPAPPNSAELEITKDSFVLALGKRKGKQVEKKWQRYNNCYVVRRYDGDGMSSGYRRKIMPKPDVAFKYLEELLHFTKPK